MRILFIAVSSVLLVAASHPDRPAFEFKGFVAGEPLSPETLKKCSGRDGARACTDFNDKIAGRPASTFIEFYNDRLTKVMALIDRENFGPVTTALTAKYGEPCRSSTSTWQNAAGASLENLELIWCFKTGELAVQRIGHRLDRMGFMYTDEHQAPPAKPTVDF